MSNDQFPDSLVDFKNLKLPDQNNDLLFFKSLSSSHHSLTEAQLQLQNNDKIMKSFKQLRDQLKTSTQNCQSLRNQVNEKQAEIQKLRIGENEYITQNYQLKNDLLHSQQLCENMKRKLQYLNDSTKGARKMQEELEYLKINIIEYQQKLEAANRENKKITEISVLEKIEMEEKIKKYTVKQNRDLEYVKDMEAKLCREKEKCLQLENQLKKTQVRFDQEVYNKKWLNGTYEREHLKEQLKQIEKQNEDNLTKYKIQHEKRQRQDIILLQLEQKLGVGMAKIQSYQIQNKNLKQKCKRMEKTMEICKQSQHNQTSQSLAWKEKFQKSISISEELIRRVKKQLCGEIVNLAKSCDFKLKKLRDEEKLILKALQKKSESMIKKRSKSERKQKKALTSRKIQNLQNDVMNSVRAKLNFNFDEGSQKFSIDQNTARRINRKQSVQLQQCINQKSLVSATPLKSIDNLELNIRQERQKIQKKIKEKMLFQKIQASSSPQKHQLREQYLKFVSQL